MCRHSSHNRIFRYIFCYYCTGRYDGAIPNMNEDEEWLHPIDGLPPDPTDLPRGCAFSPRCKYAADACRQGPIPLHRTADGHDCRCCRIEAVLKEEG